MTIRTGPPHRSIAQLAADQGITTPATLDTLPRVDVFDDGEVEQFLAHIAEARRAES